MGVLIECVISVGVVWAIIHAWILRRWSHGWHLALSGKMPVSDEIGPLNWTVLIPARNEAHNLPQVLDDLQKQHIQVDIVLVDDHSTDCTLDVARDHNLTRKGQMKVLTANGEGKKSAILTGLRSINTPWLVTLDADVRLGPKWAQMWHTHLLDISDEFACVAGPVVLTTNPDKPSLWQAVQALDYAAQMGWSVHCIAKGLPASASGANMAVRCDTYPDTRSMGPSGDDTLVIQQLQRDGHLVTWLSDSRATVRTAGAYSLRSWMQQRTRWAGKAVHYDARTKRTAWWMASMAFLQWSLWLGACVSAKIEMWAFAWGWWVAITFMNLAYVRPIAKWFGLRTTWMHGFALGLTQPAHVPLVLLAQAGLLRPFGIASKPIWKGRTCST